MNLFISGFLLLGVGVIFLGCLIYAIKEDLSKAIQYKKEEIRQLRHEVHEQYKYCNSLHEKIKGLSVSISSSSDDVSQKP